MKLLNLLKIAYKALIRNKTRALLTMLGIVIGISSVIAMVSLGQSSQQNINNEISSMGTNLIMVMRNNQRQGGVSIGSSNVQSLTAKKDCDAILKNAQYVSKVSPIVNANGQLVYGSNNWPGSMQEPPDIMSIKKYELSSGTNFMEKEVKAMPKYVLLENSR